jgi:ATP-dependent protease HslVU (ClpYQ) peptidase subunit
MTCIVGIADKKTKKVIMGGDSAGVDGYSIFIRKDEKIFKNGLFVIGCTTSFRMIQLLRYSFKPPKINNKNLYEYMCTDFIDKVRECFKEGGYLQKFTDGDERGGDFLVAYKDRLFKVENDFQVGETESGIDACGCGMDFALGALYALNEQKMSTEDKLLKSLESAEFLSNAVCRPFHLIST